MASTFQPPINLDPHQDPTQQTAFINQNFQQLASSLNPFIVSDGTNNRIILGKQTDGTYGMKVSQAGIDVGTATNSQLIFNSSQNIFKIVQKGTSSIPTWTIGAGQSNYASITIPHGQSYTPIVEVYAKGYIVNSSIAVVASSYIPLPFLYNGSSGTSPANNYYFPNASGSQYYGAGMVFAVDATNIYIEVSTSSSAAADTVASIPLTYYILQETAT